MTRPEEEKPKRRQTPTVQIKLKVPTWEKLIKLKNGGNYRSFDAVVDEALDLLIALKERMKG